MCRGKQICTELGDQPNTWSKEAPLAPPAWFSEQLTAFSNAVRSAAAGEVTSARDQLRIIRSDDLRTWYVEHGKQAGFCRYPHLGRLQPEIAMSLPDPKRHPDRLMNEFVFKRDGYRCRYCTLRIIPKEVLEAFSKVVGVDAFCTTGTDLQRYGAALAFRAIADHVVPWSFGGRTDPDNLVTACWPCNFGKDRFTLGQIGLEDPRTRAVQAPDTWDGLVSLVPELQRRAVRNVRR